MITGFLDNKKLAVMLLSIITLLALFVWTISRSKAAVTSNIVYFVPEDTELIEKEVLPSVFNRAKLTDFEYVNEVESTTDWKMVQKLASEKQLDVLIIHHATENVVPWDEVKSWFQEDGVMIGGIGMAGDQLAKQLGAPRLFIEQGANEMDFDYFLYAIEIEGQPEDEQKIIDAGFDSENVATIRAPLAVGGSSSRGFLSGSTEDTMHFLGSINGYFIGKHNANMGGQNEKTNGTQNTPNRNHHATRFTHHASHHFLLI